MIDYLLASEKERGIEESHTHRAESREYALRKPHDEVELTTHGSAPNRQDEA